MLACLEQKWLARSCGSQTTSQLSCVFEPILEPPVPPFRGPASNFQGSYQVRRSLWGNKLPVGTSTSGNWHFLYHLLSFPTSSSRSLFVVTCALHSLGPFRSAQLLTVPLTCANDCFREPQGLLPLLIQATATICCWAPQQALCWQNLTAPLAPSLSRSVSSASTSSLGDGLPALFFRRGPPLPVGRNRTWSARLCAGEAVGGRCQL